MAAFEQSTEGDTGIVMVRVWIEPADSELRGRVIVPSIEHGAAVGTAALRDVVERAINEVRDELLRRRDVDVDVDVDATHEHATHEHAGHELASDERDADATRD